MKNVKLLKIALMAALLPLCSGAAIANGAQTLKGSDATASNQAIDKPDYNMWGWQNGTTCQGKKREIRWVASEKRFICKDNPNIKHVK